MLQILFRKFDILMYFVHYCTYMCKLLLQQLLLLINGGIFGIARLLCPNKL